MPLYVRRMTDDDDTTFCELASRFWHPVARSIDVVPGAVMPVRLLGRDLAVFRAGDGTVSVLDDLCAHRGARLSAGAVDRDCLRCPYHSWAYARDGQCVDIPQLGADHTIPAQARVAFVSRVEHAGLIWTALVDEREELRPRPTWPVTDADTHWLHVGAVYEWKAQAFRQIENFCDVAHFSVLHADTFGNDEQLEMEPYHVEASDDGYRLSFDYDYPSRDPTVEPAPGEKRPLAGTKFEYRLELPFTVALANASGPGTVMCVAASPTSASTMNLFWLCAFRSGSRSTATPTRSSSPVSGCPIGRSSRASAPNVSRSTSSKSCTFRSIGSQSRTGVASAKSASQFPAG